MCHILRKILLLLRNISNLDKLDCLKRLIEHLVLLRSLLHLEHCNIFELVLNKVLAIVHAILDTLQGLHQHLSLLQKLQVAGVQRDSMESRCDKCTMEDSSVRSIRLKKNS